ncbi:MAG: glycerol-3-phosphate 1-O-acyltransferase PlsY [Gammaproteobacteria bacterium]
MRINLRASDVVIWSVVAIVVSYLLGSVPGGLLLGRLIGVDLRTQGSGNAGATNAVRARGPLFGVAVFAFDAAKGVIAVALLPHLNAASAEWLAPACAGAVIVGHVFPVWFRFRGGKGFATALGVLLMLSPLALAVVAGVWIVVLVLTGYVSAATLCGALAFPIFVALADRGQPAALMVFAVALAVFLLYTHRSNVLRLMRGTEHRFHRVRLLGRGRG